MNNARDQRADRGARQQQPAQALVEEVNDEGGQLDDVVQNQVPEGQGAAGHAGAPMWCRLVCQRRFRQ